MTGFTLFPTALGTCGIAWSDDGIAGVALPGGDAAATAGRLRRAHPEAQRLAPPTEVRAAIDAIARLLDGEPEDLGDVALDLARVPDFHRRVYAAARVIPPGETRSYGELAAAIGERGAARAVGQALGRNPFPIVVPCHRVLAAGGGLGGFSAPGGTATKRRMLALEGAAPPTLFD